MNKIIHTTIEGETLSDICFKYFGDVKGFIDSVYDQNLWVSEYPSLLPSGLKIEIDLGLRKERVIDDKMELW